ncbi:MAG: TetR family transcriptional regulator [Deltaproteobacteria bacterium]|nr:MAG: TetR family transcriptional regulator [Deltaproteobacteria bacterium]
MKNMSQHTEWLSMIEVSGPFLAVSVLEKVFPQGLESLETYRKKRIRSAYEEWRDAVEEDDPQLPELHRAWIGLVLEELLEYEDSVLEAASDEFTYKSPDGDGQFKPDFVLRGDGGSAPMLFVSIMPEGTDLEKVKVGDGWPVPVFERMTLLCRDKGVRLGLVTNGERWMLVNAPVGSTSSHVSWYARLWFQEPVTLKAFQSLLGVRRWFGPEGETLPAILEDSLSHHEEVTDTLGEQVKRAVEVLVQCLDKADQDRNRELLHDVPPAELYEAGLTVMMRLVFVLCAEERGLLLLDDPVYDQHYAITTLRGQLAEEADQHGHEVLERRHDAWTRLLAVFRAVYGGIEHESLRMPALGGSLFDPDRFPFLEGRAKGTHWQETPAQPLPIDNRTVLLLLEALQVLEQRGGALLLSYKALDVEQIGHVYEGLLEHTVRRLKKDTLGLIGSQEAKNPNIALAELESTRLDGEDALISIVEATTSRSTSAITNALAKEVDDATFGKIVTVCGGDMELAARLKPFAHLLRSDAWGDFIVYHAHSFAVTLGADRRETGTHYTPKSLTESIVETTLEPVAYVGPAEGKPREAWQLKSSAELMELKICDPAMGSGAFLVQVCRWLSERLVEAWGKETGLGKFITVDGIALESAGSAEPMPDSLDERLLIARRLVAEKCLYGVDLNPLAVELAKLSIWLITLAKGRPFGFLDHNLRSGDSLLGLHKLEQLTKFSLHPEKKKTISMFASNIEAAVKDALSLRKQLRETPIRDIRDVQYMERLDQEARQKLEHIEHIADAMIGEALASGGNQRVLDNAMDNLSTWAAAYIEGDNETGRKIIAEARTSLSIDLPVGKPPRKPFHWALEFPEVFERGGFDGIVGNPPFMGGKKISGNLGPSYRSFITKYIGNGAKGNADLCAYFFLKNVELLEYQKMMGLMATNTIAQGETREVGLDQVVENNNTIVNAIPSKVWPGKANIHVAIAWVCRTSQWGGNCFLNGKEVKGISSYLVDSSIVSGTPYQLYQNQNIVYGGQQIQGEGFVLSPEEATKIIQADPKNKNVVFQYLSGKDVTTNPDHKANRWVINFFDWPLKRDDIGKLWTEASDKDKKSWLQKGIVPLDYSAPVAADYPECFEIVERLVKPQREKCKRKIYREKWWLYAERQPKLINSLSRVKRVLFHSFTGKYVAFAFVDKNKVFAGPHNVILLEKYAHFSILQSALHCEWVYEYGSTMKGDVRYAPSDILKTFPFPALTAQLETVGEQYYKYRNAYMLDYNKGLTATYNCFNDVEDSSEDILTLRNIQAEMDQSVTTAYGWDDLDLGHGFHETKQGIRFTISEDARREVLQRLLKLNHERYEEEVAQGLHDKKKKKASTPRKKKTSPAKDDGNMDLFNFMNASSKGSK